MSKKVLALPGDGVGPEVISSAASAISASTEDVDLVFGDIGVTAYNKTDHYLPPETIDLAIDSDAIISGEVFKKNEDIKYRDPLRVLKKQLNLYCIMRKFRPLSDNIGCKGTELIIMTGNTDALMNVIEKENLDGVISEKFITTESCRKLFQMTMRVAENKGRHKITCAHRSEMFPHMDGSFVDLFYKEMAASPFTIEDAEVEEIASRLIVDPTSFDVLVCTDIYGATLSGLCAGLVGGTYLTPMGSIGDTQGLFEPMHGPKPNVEGGIVNPTSAILSGALAMDHIGLPEAGEKIREAVRKVYATGKVTPDVGGTATCAEFTDHVIETIKNQM